MAFQFPAGITTSTINAFLKEVAEPIYRKSILVGLLKNRKRIKFNQDGPAIVWPVRYYRQKPRNIAGPVTATQFPNIAPEVQCTVPMAGYDMGRSITKAEKLVNKGEARIYNLVQRAIEQVGSDFLEYMRLYMWGDGTITGNDVMGVMSMFGASSTPSADGVYNNPGTYSLLSPASGATNWPVASPSQTYAGQSTALGSKVNDWVGPTAEAFPHGTFSPGYNFFSPMIWDYNSSSFTPNSQVSTTLTHDWNSQWQQVVNDAFTYLTLLQRDKPDMLVLDANLLSRAQNSTIAQQRFIVSSASESKSLGFDTLEYNGYEFATEYGVPPGCGVILTFDKMKMFSWQDDWMERSEDKDPQTSEDLYKVDAYWQMQFESPANFALLAPISAVGT